MSFYASYRGRCEYGCGAPIEPGQAVEYVDDTLVHSHCVAVDPDEPRRNERQCPNCFTIHAGECL